jgi:hypothetical protein
LGCTQPHRLLHCTNTPRTLLCRLRRAVGWRRDGRAGARHAELCAAVCRSLCTDWNKHSDVSWLRVLDPERVHCDRLPLAAGSDLSSARAVWPLRAKGQPGKCLGTRISASAVPFRRFTRRVHSDSADGAQVFGSEGRRKARGEKRLSGESQVPIDTGSYHLANTFRQ